MKLMTRDHSHLGSYLKLAPAKFETFAAQGKFMYIYKSISTLVNVLEDGV